MVPRTSLLVDRAAVVSSFCVCSCSPGRPFLLNTLDGHSGSPRPLRSLPSHPFPAPDRPLPEKERGGHSKERDSGHKHNNKGLRDQLSATDVNDFLPAAPLPHPSFHITSSATDIMHGEVGVRAQQQISVCADVTADGHLPLSPPPMLSAVRNAQGTADAHLEDSPDAHNSWTWRPDGASEWVWDSTPGRQGRERFEAGSPWDALRAGHRSLQTSTSARALGTSESSGSDSFDGTLSQKLESIATSDDWDGEPGGERPFLRRAWSAPRACAEGGAWISQAPRMDMLTKVPVAGHSSTTFFLDEALDADAWASGGGRKQQLQQLRKSCLTNTGDREGRLPPILLNPALSDDSRIHPPRSNHSNLPGNSWAFSPMVLRKDDAGSLGRALTEMQPRDLSSRAQQSAGAGAGAVVGGAAGMDPVAAVGTASSVWVSRHVDYSSKFGRLFLLTDGSVSILFNDDTKMAIEPTGVAFDYVEHSVVRRSRQGVELAATRGRGQGCGSSGLRCLKMRYTVDFFPFFLKKKVQILRHCRDRMFPEGSQLVTGQAPVASGQGGLELGGGLTERPITFVERWQRSSRTFCFRLSDQSVQVRAFLCTPGRRFR